MSDQPTPETSLPRTMSASEAEARRELLAAQSENQRLREDGAYLKLQRDRLLEITWLDLPSEPHESTARWAEEFDKGWLRREPAEAERDALASQVATLAAERDAEKDEAELKQLALNGQLSECDKLAAQRDQLRTQNAALLSDYVVMRGVMKDVAELAATEDHRAFSEIRQSAEDALATPSPGAPLIEAVRKAVDLLQSQHRLLVAAHAHIDWSKNDAVIADLQKFLP